MISQTECQKCRILSQFRIDHKIADGPALFIYGFLEQLVRLSVFISQIIRSRILCAFPFSRIRQNSVNLSDYRVDQLIELGFYVHNDGLGYILVVPSLFIFSILINILDLAESSPVVTSCQQNTL